MRQPSDPNAARPPAPPLPPEIGCRKCRERIINAAINRLKSRSILIDMNGDDKEAVWLDDAIEALREGM